MMTSKLKVIAFLMAALCLSSCSEDTDNNNGGVVPSNLDGSLGVEALTDTSCAVGIGVDLLDSVTRQAISFANVSVQVNSGDIFVAEYSSERNVYHLDEVLDLGLGEYRVNVLASGYFPTVATYQMNCANAPLSETIELCPEGTTC